MAEHTQTPWYFEELERNPDGCGYIRCDTDSLEISHHGDRGRSRDENLANAAFIVDACNNHDRLTRENEAMRGTLEVIASRVTWEGGRYVPTYEAEVARAALTSLKERA